jgi:hypothetical protein
VSYISDSKANRVTPGSAFSGRIIAAYLAFFRAGLIVILDRNYEYKAVGDGIAQKWGLGKSCHEYEEFFRRQKSWASAAAKEEALPQGLE